MKGQLIGPYRVTGVLGQGGMGTVYAAEHTLLGRAAAVKVLLPELSGHQDIVQRFFNEARAAAAIRHPSIVEIYDFGWTPDSAAYIVMEYLQGESLRTRRARGPMPVSAALAITRQIAGALGAAHAKGIVHRDLKPDNIFLVHDPEVPGGERIKLLDFGIAKLADASPQAHKTRTGVVMGTPTYMAPEQCRGVAIDSRADLYSLGCILFELCTGRAPFVGEGEGDVLAAHIHVPAPLASSLAPAIPREVDALVLRMLAKVPAQRVQTADEVIRLIDAASAASGGRAPTHAGYPSSPGMAPIQPSAGIPQSVPTSALPQSGPFAERSGPVAQVAPSAPRAFSTPPPTEVTPVRQLAGEPKVVIASPTLLAHPETTLSSAASMQGLPAQPGERRRTALFAGAGLAAAVVSAIVVAVAASGDDTPKSPATAAAVADAELPAPPPSSPPSPPPADPPASAPLPAPTTTRPPAPEPAKPEPATPAPEPAKPAPVPAKPAPAPEPAKPAGPAPAPKPATIDVAIDSSPAGATVALDGAVVGKTPYRGKRAREHRELKLELKLAGHRTETLTVRASSAITKSIKLTRSDAPHNHSVNPFAK